MRLIVLWLASSLLIQHSLAQPIRFEVAGPAPAQLGAPHVNVVAGPTAARLEQAKALAADQNWGEAVEVYRELINDRSGRLVELHHGRYVTLPTYCHMQIARLPAEGLAVYRRRVDPLAERWYREGIAMHDETALRRVVDEAFCSSWGDDALLALGEPALERADFEAARRAWQRMSPFVRGPDGRPLWLVLHGINLDTHGPEVERLWNERDQPPDWLAYPDTEFDLADIRARLILVSIRAGELHRAALELAAFRRFHPEAAGRLGGQEGPYASALDRLLSAARNWPEMAPTEEWTTFAANQSRSGIAPPLGPIMGPAWPQAVDLEPTPQEPPAESGMLFGGGFGGGPFGNEQPSEPQQTVRESQRPLSCFPIVVNDLIVFNDDARIRAASIATGKPALTADGVIHREQRPGEPPRRAPFAAGGMIGDGASHGIARHTLTAVGSVVYSRAGSPVTTRIAAQEGPSASRLVGVDLARDGLLTFHARPSDASWSFDGAPVGDGRRLWVAMRHSDVSPHAYVACFDATSGVELWRTSIGAADTPAGGGNEISHNLLTLVGNRLFFNSDLGLVAALDARDGKIAWLYRYDRAKRGPSPLPARAPRHFDRGPSPCVYHNGLVLVAPADSPSIFALDAHTGQQIWTTDHWPDALHLLGVVDHNLVVSGDRLSVLDIRTGAERYTWPESEHAGIRGMGRGLIAGNEVFWPTRHEVYILNAHTGQQSRSPISLRAVGENGANLAAGHGYLIAAAHDKLMAFGRQPARQQAAPAE